MQYLPRNGSYLSATDAAVLGQRFELLAQDSVLRPEAVVDDARSESSPTHHYFDWDDAAAAEQYRVNQARYYLRSIEVVREEHVPAVRAFYVVTKIEDEGDTQKKGYAHIETVLHDKELWRQVVAEERRKLEATIQRLRNYEELAHIAEGALRQAIEMMLQVEAS
jgi:hypothetical protein